MKITVKELTTIGPTIHSSFVGLPYIKTNEASQNIIKPVLAYQSPSCIKIVGNIHHFLARQAAGDTTVPVYLIQDSESTLELLELVIEYYAPMNLMDKAHLTRAALELGIPRSMLAEKVFPLMALAPREKLIDQILFLLKLPKELQTFLVEKDLSLKRAVIFQRASDHLEWVSLFITNLRIGINMTAEIIQNVWEMAKRDEMPFKDMAMQMGLWEMAYEEYDDTRFAVLEIRAKINAARFPSLTKAGHDLSKTIEEADLPDGVKVKWDPYFERQGIDLSAHVKDQTELEVLLDKLTSPSFKNIFKQI